MLDQVFLQEQISLLFVNKINEGLTPEEIEQKNNIIQEHNGQYY